MAETTTMEIRMTMESAILDLSNKTAGMKIDDGGEEYSSNFHNRITEIKQTEIDFDNDKTGLDQDQDRKHPAYIPRKGRFFMHDTRETVSKQKKPFSRADCKWQHDLYVESQQQPMSDLEFAQKYGEDRNGNPIHLVSRKTVRDANPTKNWAPTEAWNAQRRSARPHKNFSRRQVDSRNSVGVLEVRDENSFFADSDIRSKSSGAEKEDVKSDSGEELQNRRKGNSGTNKKLESRHAGKRYSTQRPMRTTGMHDSL